ncbi:hypothetical protein C7475_109146 [Chitinophaga sp. S165]|nr:hypothetical protein C7475_109146 [Chitinophaga sp. S165]
MYYLRTDQEVNELQDLGQRLYHKETNYAGDSYKLHLLGDLRIISLETLSRKTTNLQQIRFEDFAPLKVIKKLPQHRPSATIKEMVKAEVAEALKYLDEFEKHTAAIHASTDANIQRDLFAYLSTVTPDATTELTQAMLDIDYFKIDNGQYIVSHKRLWYKHTPYFTLAKEAFDKIADHLKVTLHQEFYCEYRLD